MFKAIEVVSYDANWPNIFEKEAVLIRQALADNCIAIHHVGSTSVPGLAAKPKIDMIAVVKQFHHCELGEVIQTDKSDASKILKSLHEANTSLATTVQALEKIGIQYRGEYNIPLHYGFRKKGDADLNLHVYEESHPEIELNLMFRDYLRVHQNMRDAYTQLKEELIQDKSSFNKENNSPFTNYTLRKGDFIRNVLREAGFNKVRILKCNDDTEWSAAKHFRNKYFFEPYGIADPYTWTFNHEEHSHLVLYRGTEIIGYAHIQFWPYRRAAIRIIATDENKRNQNFGSSFLALIEKWLRSLGVKSIHAESRQTSLGFYLKNGYTGMSFNDPENHESDPNDIPVGKVYRNHFLKDI